MLKSEKKTVLAIIWINLVNALIIIAWVNDKLQ